VICITLILSRLESTGFKYRRPRRDLEANVEQRLEGTATKAPA
jgi:hypothetical protein